MQAGKLPIDVLGRLLDRVEITDPRVALGPRAGEDAALIDYGDRFLVAKTDPITFATDLIGWYMVNVNANDIAVMGATPKWMLATLLLPEGTDEQRITEIFEQLREACSDLNISLVGGHTEITYGLDRPVAVGALLGEVDKDAAVFSSGVRPGDDLLLTKGIAIEGASILAREATQALLDEGVDREAIETAALGLHEPGISVVRDAQIACAAGDVHAMHDPTEGGISGGLYELAAASGLGLEVDSGVIPVLPDCAAICDALGLDPLGLIASGALLAAVAPEGSAAVVDALVGEGIPAFVIGRATGEHQNVKLYETGKQDDFPRFSRDEIARYFSDQ